MIDVAVRDGFLACLLYSIELSDCALMDSEVWDEDCSEVSGVTDDSSGAEVISRVETLFVTMSTIDLGLADWGTSIPRSEAICRRCSSTSSSVWSKRKTIMRYVSLSLGEGFEVAFCPT